MADFGDIYVEHFLDEYKYVLSHCRYGFIAEEVTQTSELLGLQNHAL